MSFFSSLFGATTQQNDSIKILNKTDYATAIEANNVQLVDVRTPQEYRGGYIKNAINIDYFNQANFAKEFSKLDKEKPVYLYCRSGNRSQSAASKLVAMGFKEIYDLAGGYMRW